MLHKKSNQRARILEILKGTDEHPTADWVYQKLKPEMPNLSLGTVYRNLNVLVEQGLIQKMTFGSTFDRYDAQVHAHIHLICEKCGRVEDCDVPLSLGNSVLNGNKSKFFITQCRMEYIGICEHCHS